MLGGHAVVAPHGDFSVHGISTGVLPVGKDRETFTLKQWRAGVQLVRGKGFYNVDKVVDARMQPSFTRKIPG
eukprot:1349347-Amorphochlora_amoeboformis.AAC.1